MAETTKIELTRGDNSLRRLPLGRVALLVVVLHFSFLMAFFEPAISTPDAHGYFAQARMMAREGTTFLEPQSLVQYLGPEWKRTWRSFAQHSLFVVPPLGGKAPILRSYPATEGRSNAKPAKAGTTNGNAREKLAAVKVASLYENLTHDVLLSRAPSETAKVFRPDGTWTMALDPQKW